MRALRSLTSGTLAAGALAAVALLGASRADAQALGPQRQFLAIEPYYEFTRLDVGMNDQSATATMNGYGARLWINGAPFHLPLNSSIALFATYAPSRSQNTPQTYPAGPIASGFSTLHYGAQIDQFFVRRPLGGVIDPFLSVGLGAYRFRFDDAIPIVGGTSERHLALSPGGGVRVPLPNRFELRADVRDLMLFGVTTNVAGAQKTTHNLVAQGAFGVTF